MKYVNDTILQANIDKTKEYVANRAVQMATLPTASSTLVGKLYQYTGTTTNTYTHGYFYECQETSTEVYEWVNVPVSEGGGTGGGHTILDGSGSAMAQRTNLQFVGGNVKDDSTNDKTVVTVDRELTQAEYDALSTAEQNNGTNYFITDAPSSYTGVPQSMIGDAWVASHAYAVDDYCIDGNVLYRCKTAHTSTASNRPPYASYWDAVTVASQLGGGKSVSINLTLGDTRKQIAKTIAQNIDFSKVTANTVFHFEAYYNNAKYSIAYQVIRFSDSNITISTNIDINNDTSSEVFIGTIENSNNTRWQRIIFNSNGSISWSNEASSVMYASGTYTSPKCTVIY